MLWALADRFVDEVIAFYGSREQAERALRAILADEPDWSGMMEILAIPVCEPHWRPKGKPIRRPRCRERF